MSQIDHILSSLNDEIDIDKKVILEYFELMIQKINEIDIEYNNDYIDNNNDHISNGHDSDSDVCSHDCSDEYSHDCCDDNHNICDNTKISLKVHTYLQRIKINDNDVTICMPFCLIDFFNTCIKFKLFDRIYNTLTNNTKIDYNCIITLTMFKELLSVIDWKKYTNIGMNSQLGQMLQKDPIKVFDIMRKLPCLIDIDDNNVCLHVYDPVENIKAQNELLKKRLSEIVEECDKEHKQLTDRIYEYEERYTTYVVRNAKLRSELDFKNSDVFNRFWHMVRNYSIVLGIVIISLSYYICTEQCNHKNICNT